MFLTNKHKQTLNRIGLAMRKPVTMPPGVEAPLAAALFAGSLGTASYEASDGAFTIQHQAQSALGVALDLEYLGLHD